MNKSTVITYCLSFLAIVMFHFSAFAQQTSAEKQNYIKALKQEIKKCKKEVRKTSPDSYSNCKEAENQQDCRLNTHIEFLRRKLKKKCKRKDKDITFEKLCAKTVLTPKKNEPKQKNTSRVASTSTSKPRNSSISKPTSTKTSSGGSNQELLELRRENNRLKKELSRSQLSKKDKNAIGNYNRLVTSSQQKTYIKDKIEDEEKRYYIQTFMYRGHEYEAVVLDMSKINDLHVDVYRGSKKKRLKNAGDLQKRLKKKGSELLFATNAGMYNEDRSAVGLLVAEGKKVNDINVIPKAYGNFYLQPNGIFYKADGVYGVQQTSDYQKKNKKNVEFATQSGPMLVINGKMHDVLRPGSKNLATRSGVGISQNIHTNYLVFLISKDRVNLHTFASIFKDYFQCENALFLDGNVSRWYTKEGKRKETDGDFSALIGFTDKK